MDDLPNAEPLFRAVREYLSQAGTGGFMLYDQVSGCYVAVNPEISDMADAVYTQLAWRKLSGRPPDVMADTGEIVNDFTPIYPPPGQPPR